MTGWIIFAGIVIIVFFWFVGTYNMLVRYRNMVRESFSTMDVYMKKRYDLIPNLVETVKGYANHESATLERVIEARNSAQNSRSLEERAEDETLLNGSLKSLFALSEAYPDLKANTNFMNLQKQMQSVEVDIANSRKYYNAVVRDYNIKIESFPSSIIASAFNFEKEQQFEIAILERENVKVRF